MSWNPLIARFLQAIQFLSYFLLLSNHHKSATKMSSLLEPQSPLKCLAGIELTAVESRGRCKWTFNILKRDKATSEIHYFLWRKLSFSTKERVPLPSTHIPLLSAKDSNSTYSNFIPPSSPRKVCFIFPDSIAKLLSTRADATGHYQERDLPAQFRVEATILNQASALALPWTTFAATQKELTALHFPLIKKRAALKLLII